MRHVILQYFITERPQRAGKLTAYILYFILLLFLLIICINVSQFICCVDPHFWRSRVLDQYNVFYSTIFMKTCKTFQPFLIHYMSNLVPLYDKAKPTEPTKSCWHLVNMYLFVKYLVCHSEGTRNSFFFHLKLQGEHLKNIYIMCESVIIF